MILKRMKRRHLRADAMRFCRGGAAPAARHRARRRSHRRLPDRDRGDVRQFAAARRRSAASSICTSSRSRRAWARRPPACRRSTVPRSRSARRACAQAGDRALARLSRCTSRQKHAGAGRRRGPWRARRSSPRSRCSAAPPAGRIVDRAPDGPAWAAAQRGDCGVSEAPKTPSLFGRLFGRGSAAEPAGGSPKPSRRLPRPWSRCAAEPSSRRHSRDL